MKKTAIIFVLILVFSLTACKAKDSSKKGFNTEEKEKQEENRTEDEKSKKDKEEETGKKLLEEGREALYGLNGKKVDLKLAFESMEKALSAGVKEANLYLGYLYDYYSYPTVNYHKAAKYYETVKDNLYAMLALGRMYFDVKADKRDLKEAERLFQAALDQGCVEANLGLGLLKDLEGEPIAAYEYYEKAMAGQEPLLVGEAYRQAAALYFYGMMADGEPNSEAYFAKGIALCEKGIALNSFSCILELANHYFYGWTEIDNVPKAIALLEKGAQMGMVDAMVKLGNLYLEDYKIEVDVKKAKEWFEKAIEWRSGFAAILLGEIYLAEMESPNHEKAKEYYAKAEELVTASEDAAQMEMLGKSYALQLMDFSKSEEWLEKSAAIALKDRNDWVLYHIAQTYIAQESPNWKKGTEYFQKAAELNNEMAMMELAMIHKKGLIEEANPVEALRWYQKASEFGNSEAQFQVGLAYYEGNGTDSNFEEAIHWFERAAEHFHPEAVSMLGWMYMNGEGVELDYTEAMRRFESAAEYGENNAMNNIGYLYENGYGVEQNFKKAMEWYVKSAEAGNRIAMQNIAILYENGRGIPVDKKKAKEWRDRAETEIPNQ